MLKKAMFSTFADSDIRKLRGGLTRPNFQLIGILNERRDSVYNEILWVPLKNQMRSQTKWSEYPSGYELFRTPCGDVKFCLATSTIETPRLHVQRNGVPVTRLEKRPAFILNQPRSSISLDSARALARKTDIQYKLRWLCLRSLKNVKEAVALLAPSREGKLACDGREDLAERFEAYLAINDISDLKACLGLIREDNAIEPTVTQAAQRFGQAASETSNKGGPLAAMRYFNISSTNEDNQVQYFAHRVGVSCDMKCSGQERAKDEARRFVLASERGKMPFAEAYSLNSGRKYIYYRCWVTEDDLFQDLDF